MAASTARGLVSEPEPMRKADLSPESDPRAGRIGQGLEVLGEEVGSVWAAF